MSTLSPLMRWAVPIKCRSECTGHSTRCNPREENPEPFGPTFVRCLSLSRRP